MRRRLKTRNDTKSRLTAKAEISTIASAFIAVLALVIASISVVIAIAALRVQIFELNRIAMGIEEMQPIQVGMQISKDGIPVNMNTVIERGDRLLVQITFNNAVRGRMEYIGARVILPNTLIFEEGSMQIFNQRHPMGRTIEDSIMDATVVLGGFNDFNDRGRGSGTIMFAVSVSPYETLFSPGRNEIEISASVGGVVDGVLVSDIGISQTTVAMQVDRILGEQAIQLNIGVSNEEGMFVQRVNATHGDEILVQFTFKNNSGFRMSTIGGRISLPDALEFVPDSTRLFNRTNPNGAPMGDGIAEMVVNFGGYNPFDEDGRGSGSVSFRVRVSDDENLFPSGENAFRISAQVSGYRDGRVVTDTFIAYAVVDVNSSY